MILSHRDPFDQLFALQRALEARRESNWMEDATTGSGSFPPINVFQQGDDLVAIIELQGVDKNNIEIQAKSNTIRISGQKLINYGEQVSVHRRERVFGFFDRTLSLPIQVNTEGMRADYQNGILALFIPRAESEKPRKIKIK